MESIKLIIISYYSKSDAIEQLEIGKLDVSATAVDDVNKYIEYRKDQYIGHVTATGKRTNNLVHFLYESDWLQDVT